jgi:hypothetical protein
MPLIQVLLFHELKNWLFLNNIYSLLLIEGTFTSFSKANGKK